MGTSNGRAGNTAATALSRVGRVFATPSTTLTSSPASGGGSDPGWISGFLDSLGIWGGGTSGTSGTTTTTVTWPDVVNILDRAVGGSSTVIRARHGAFWRSIACSRIVTMRLTDLPGMSTDPRITGSNSSNNGRLFVPRNPGNSYLLRALKGQAPFNGTFSRMPMGAGSVSSTDIATIESWINGGCPCPTSASPTPTPAPPSTAIPTWSGSRPIQIDSTMRSHGNSLDSTHNQFWREFDYWSLSQVRVSGSAVENLMNQIQSSWATARTGGSTRAWDTYVNSSSGVRDVQAVAEGMAETMRSAYGEPLPISEIYDGFAKFGANTLPPDSSSMRSISASKSLHCMDYRNVWPLFAGLADGCVRQGHETSCFSHLYKAILIGFACDVYHFSNQSGADFTRNQRLRANNRPSSLPTFSGAPSISDITTTIHGLSSSNLFSTLVSWL